MQAVGMRCIPRWVRPASSWNVLRRGAASSSLSHGVSYVYPSGKSAGQLAPVPVVGDSSGPSDAPPAQGSVKVAFLAAGVSSLDISMLAKPPKSEQVAGLEGVAKVIASASSASGPQPGTFVVPRRIGAFGTFREHAELSVDDVIALPDDVPVETAATLGIAPRSAWAALEQLKAPAGSLIAIGGAETPLGQAAVQIASSRGLRVIAVLNDKDAESWKPLSQLVKILGAECVLPESSALKPGSGVSAVLSDLGKAAAGIVCGKTVHAAGVKKLVKNGGNVVSATEDLATKDTSSDTRMFEELVSLAVAGKLRLWLRKMKLSEIGTAFEQTRNCVGDRKVVLFTKEGERMLQSSA